MTTATRATRTLLPHPLANIFPKADADVFTALMESFRQVGWDPTHPIVTYRGTILDGRNRLYAAEEFNKSRGVVPVVPTYREFVGTDEEAADFALRENLARRHMTPSQRAGIGLKIRQYFERKKTGPKPPQEGITTPKGATTPTQRAAKFTNSSPRMIARASELHALDSKALDRVIQGDEPSLASAIRKAKKAAAPKCASNAQQSETDAVGLPMHPKAIEALTTGRKTYTDMILALQKMKRECVKLSGAELGRGLLSNAVVTDFDNVIRHLRNAAPYSSCPCDDPCDDKCRACAGTQWITENVFTSLPKGLKPVVPEKETVAA